MQLVVKPGDKISAEVQTRLDKGHLGYKRLDFILIQDYSGNMVAITDQFKDEDEGVIYRAFRLHELRAVQPNDKCLELVISQEED